LEKVDALEREGRIDAGHADVLRRRYEHEKLATQKAGRGEAADQERQHWQAEREVIAAQREALIELRSRGEIDNAVLRRVLNSLDLAERRIKG
jgi:ribosomal protein L19E